ncbi:hypothetical protein S140_134 [Shewanella sp. phage 1/40]|uniref:hypothetical protein n=1 Tax=Shewanella sp. phage 1/40 TaxID=1458860 RepID=UPI0004F88F80|nr:hypothetical protein S140_134 [Shewanella sp. phage 1/40]AHK11541.1 hypothetical protein S140_134 [Shewanella sp. phage 1/40]
MKLEYTGDLEIITNPKSMHTMVLPFSFVSKCGVLTTNTVKQEALKVITSHEQATIYGIANVIYSWKVI